MHLFVRLRHVVLTHVKRPGQNSPSRFHLQQQLLTTPKALLNLPTPMPPQSNIKIPGFALTPTLAYAGTPLATTLSESVSSSVEAKRSQSRAEELARCD